MIGNTLGHYEILERIGSGGMGEVYKARDTKLGRDVAVKILPPDVAADPERRKRFEREARSIAALNHPNIVTIFSVEEADGHHFLTMELVDGQPLANIIHADGLPLERFFKVAIPLAEAINSAHAAGITHRDLKPANVMIDSQGRVKVLDFGLAKLLGSDDVASPEARTVADDADTQEGRVLGTVPYMSPEQAEAKPVDHRSDIFSMGIVLYEMITGERPFQGDSSLSIMSSILRDTPSAVTSIRRDLPVQLGRIVQHCLEKDPQRRFQSALDVANELRSLRTEVSSATGSVEAVKLSRPLVNKKVGISGAVALVLLVTLFVFNPFNVEIKPEQTAEAGVNTLAVMYFDNVADPDDPKRYGEIVAELLITGLSETDHVRVVSSQRLYDILKQLGKEGEKTIDRSTATEIAKRSQAEWMMQGRILQTDPNFVITSQIVEVSSGNVTASQRITGRPGDNIFALVDRITDETLSDLSVTADEVTTETPAVAAMSTSSEEAYRYFLEGMEYTRKLFRQEARASFQQAIEQDSTFAMAYLYLSRYSSGPASDKALEQAVRYKDRATTKERMYIEMGEAWEDNDFDKVKEICTAILDKEPDDKFALVELLRYYNGIENNNQQAIATANRLLDIDPMDKNTYNTIAYLYDRVGDFDKSIWAINKYIELAPDEPNPYDTRGDLYARNGHLDDAISSYAKSVEIKPDFFDYASVTKLGHMYVFKGDYEAAAAQYRRLFSSDDPRVRSRGRSLLAMIPAHRGRIEDALRLIDTAVAADELEGLGGQTQGLYTAKGALLYAVGERAAGKDAMETGFARARDHSDMAKLGEAIAWSECGELDRASDLLSPIEAKVDSLNGIALVIYHVAAGWLEYKRQNYAEAVSLIERTRDREWEIIQFFLGRAYLGAGQYDDAIEVFEKLAKNYSPDRIQQSSVLTAKLHYYLGVAYQESGRNKDAIGQLETFLGIWDEADPRLDDLQDARERLETLKASS